MSTQSIHHVFSQDIRLPYFGEAFLARDNGKPRWLPFLRGCVHRTDGTYNQHDELSGGTGDITGFSVRVGRWFLVVDRARVEITGTTADPLTWNRTAWMALAAPAVVLSVIAAGLFKTFVAKPLRWTRESRSDLVPEL